MHDLTDKVVVITGASRGIGAAAAVEMAKSGAKVALLARNKDAIDQIAADIGDAAIAIACDVANADQVTAAFDLATVRPSPRGRPLHAEVVAALAQPVVAEIESALCRGE